MFQAHLKDQVMHLVNTCNPYTDYILVSRLNRKEVTPSYLFTARCLIKQKSKFYLPIERQVV